MYQPQHVAFSVIASTNKISLLLTVLMFLCSFTQVVQAQSDLGAVVEVSLGGSTLMNIRKGRVTLTDPSIAEISNTAGGLLLIGRKVGETNLIVTAESSSESYLIKVSLPARAIQSELAELFPFEKNARARAVGGALVLEGSVSSIQIVTQMEQVAIGYLMSPSIASLGVKPHVINLLTVQSQQQVQLDIRFAEVNRSSLREIGVNFAGNPGGRVGGSLSKPGGNGFGELFVKMYKDSSGNPLYFPFEATLKMFAERSLSRTLAEPTLVALSGESASFLAGGEQPVPQVSGLGVPSIEYKKFGIQLDFSPTVLANQTIELSTQVSVSVLDNSQSININGTSLPLFRTRASGTTVRLQNGQSFAIAGLLQDQMENSMTYLPGFGDIPILGMLFNSRSFQRRETELVVVVTARLVNPVSAADLPPLPGESSSNDPNDVGVFLMNVFEQKKRIRTRRTSTSSPTMRRRSDRSNTITDGQIASQTALSNQSAKSASTETSPQSSQDDQSEDITHTMDSIRSPSGAIGFWR